MSIIIFRTGTRRLWVSFKGLDYAFEHNCKVVITLDCGIKAVEKVKYARSKGIDVIICDHHYPGDEIPKALAVLDPKQPSCSYPYKELSGCGVGFKLMRLMQGCMLYLLVQYFITSIW